MWQLVNKVTIPQIFCFFVPVIYSEKTNVTACEQTDYSPDLLLLCSCHIFLKNKCDSKWTNWLFPRSFACLFLPDTPEKQMWQLVNKLTIPQIFCTFVPARYSEKTNVTACEQTDYSPSFSEIFCLLAPARYSWKINDTPQKQSILQGSWTAFDWCSWKTNVTVCKQSDYSLGLLEIFWGFLPAKYPWKKSQTDGCGDCHILLPWGEFISWKHITFLISYSHLTFWARVYLKQYK